MRAIFIILLVAQRSYAITGMNTTQCTNGKYFDTITLNCASCGLNQISYLDIGVGYNNIFKCQCDANYKADRDQIGWIQGRNRQAVCQPCTNCSCADNQARVYNTLTGKAQNMTCVTCASNAYRDENYKCVPCPHYSMTYNQNQKSCVCGGQFVASQGTCVAKTDVAQLQQGSIDFGNLELNYNSVSFNDYVGTTGSSQVISQPITFYYLKAAVGCKVYKDQKSCEQLANMCLITMDMQSISCRLYLILFNNDVFYENAGDVVINSVKLNLLVSFINKPKPYVHSFTYIIVEYNIAGEVIGNLRALQGELLICGTSRDDANIMTQFGRKYTKDCVFDFTQMINNYKTRFYELFLEDVDGTLIPVPVLVWNLGDPKGRKINQGNSFTDYQFIKRFFIVDTLGGLQDKQSVPTTINFAYQTSLNYIINNEKGDSIYMPYLFIRYRQISVANNQDYTADVYFGVNYTYDSAKFWTVNNILFLIFNVIVVLIWIVRVWIWVKCNPSFVAEHTWTLYLITRSFFLIIDTWSEGMFYYLMMITGYWFFFFKFQESIYVLMPSFDDYGTNYRPYEVFNCENLKACFYTMIACRCLTVLNIIHNQGELEIFFIDWEKTEISRPIDIGRERLLENQQGRNQKIDFDKYSSKVSVWRTVMIANEFNELQTFRIVSVEWTQLFVALFLVGLDWQNIAAEEPGDSLSSSASKNYVLRYFVATSVYLMIGLVQIIGRKLFDIWFPIAIEDFVDLCSIANISIVIVDDTLHGYYIHGENPVGYAEGSAEHLQNCLHYEAEGKGKQRGFIQGKQGDKSGEDHIQTFEIFLSQRFRDSYDQVFTLELKKLTLTATNAERLDNIDVLQNPVPQNLDMKAVELQRLKMAFYLKDVLSQIRANPAQCIRSKVPLQRFLGFPPPELDQDDFRNQSLPIFYRDPDYSFKNIFFCGREYFFLLCDICLFNFWLMITNNVFASLLLGYVFTKGLINYRQWLGERNLAMKSKIDQRFLI